MTGVPGFVLREGPDYAYAQVATHLEARIRAGELAPGSRLPGERDLAAEYGVALGTMRRAMDVLKEKRLVVVVPSKGVFVAEPEEPQP